LTTSPRQRPAFRTVSRISAWAAPFPTRRSSDLRFQDLRLGGAPARIFPEGFDRSTDKGVPGAPQEPAFGFVDVGDAAVRVRGHDQVPDLVQDHRLEPEFLPDPVFIGDVAEDHNHAGQGAVLPPDGGGAVGDLAFGPVPGDEGGVVGHARHLPLPEHPFHGIFRRLAGPAVPDDENFRQGPAPGLRLGPSRQGLRHRVHGDDAAVDVGGDDGVADGPQGGGQVLPVFPEGRFGPAQPGEVHPHGPGDAGGVGEIRGQVVPEDVAEGSVPGRERRFFIDVTVIRRLPLPFEFLPVGRVGVEPGHGPRILDDLVPGVARDRFAFPVPEDEAAVPCDGVDQDRHVFGQEPEPGLAPAQPVFLPLPVGDVPGDAENGRRSLVIDDPAAQFGGDVEARPGDVNRFEKAVAGLPEVLEALRDPEGVVRGVDVHGRHGEQGLPAVAQALDRHVVDVEKVAVRVVDEDGVGGLIEKEPVPAEFRSLPGLPQGVVLGLQLGLVGVEFHDQGADLPGREGRHLLGGFPDHLLDPIGQLFGLFGFFHHGVAFSNRASSLYTVGSKKAKP